ncbi:MAG: DUF885 domain-containing protein [Acidobacteriota bacterium]
MKTFNAPRLILWIAVSACSATILAGPSFAQVTQVSADERARRELADLFASSEEQKLANDPLGALGRGDRRHAGKFGDYITPDYFATLQSQARANLDRLLKVDRNLLSDSDRISFDTFRYQQERVLRGFDSGATEVLRQLPLDHLFGYHVTFPDMSSGESIAPFKTLEDYNNGLLRLQGFTTYLGRTQDALRTGIAGGHVLPRFATLKVLEQLRAAIDRGVEDSPLVGPIKNLPPEIPPEAATRLTTAYRQTVAEAVLPAYRQLADFMETVYLPASRTAAPGLAGMVDGKILYRHLIQQHTGSRLTPAEIHQLGLDEVTRIRAEMEAIRQQVGFDGSLHEFFAHLRSDGQFKFPTKTDLLQAYKAIRQRVEPQMAQLFSTLPKTGFEIRPVPEALEQTATGAYYNAGTPDGARPGIFYVNTYDLPSRTRPTMETLFLHEAIPGHHLQASLAQENDSLPDFMRFGWDTAFIEGWGLYAESLGSELGLFRDPYQRFGHLDLEMFRALRLVVDTGLHAKGWSRERALDTMLSNSSLSEAVLRADIDRYVVWPGQALAYKLGQLKIQQLRAEAESAPGRRFDPRAFHDQILGSGVLPLAILEAKVRSWIASRSEDRPSEEPS